jgi:hypothetical protein
MKIPKLQLLAAILPLAATLSLVPARVHADTYMIYGLATGAQVVVGIDNLGQVVILNEDSSEYFTYDNGVLVNTTSTLPNLTYDNGVVGCSAPAGFLTIMIINVCNNGRIGFGSFSNPNGDATGVYTGPVSDLTFVKPDETIFSTPVLNSSGDFAWTGGNSDSQIEESYEAVDLTTLTPEPGSLLLVGTGCFSLLCVLRRKLSLN